MVGWSDLKSKIRMEIAIVGSNSLKIKSKNTSFIVNPEKKVDEDVAILTSKPDSYDLYQGKLVIDGPGDYETAGVSIKGEKDNNGMSYEFFEEGQRLVVLSNPKLAENADIEDATVVVTYVAPETVDEVSKISSEVVAIIGNEAALPSDKSNTVKIDKLNLKKTEEYKGSLIHLSK